LYKLQLAADFGRVQPNMSALVIQILGKAVTEIFGLNIKRNSWQSTEEYSHIKTDVRFS
jgi:hypothetical protein